MIQKLNINQKRGSIKLKLIIIPLIVVFMAIISINAISTYLTRNSLLEQMRDSGMEIATQAARQIEDYDASVKAINGMIEDKIRATARIVTTNNANLSNEFLIQLAKDLDITVVNVFNDQGEVVYTTHVDTNLGLVVPDDHFARRVPKEPAGELMEDIRKGLTDENFYKFGYVHDGKGGAIQVGILANEAQALWDRFSYQRLVDSLGEEESVVYALFIDKNVTAVAHSNEDRIGMVLEDKGSITAAVDGKSFTSEFTYKGGENEVEVYDVLLPVSVDGEHIGAINLGISMEAVQSTINQNIKMVYGVGIIAFLILSLILFRLSNYAIKTLNITKTYVNSMAEGDFSIAISQKHLNLKDEFGEIINAIEHMKNSIKEIVKNIGDTAQLVSSSSEELTATSQQSSIAADEVAKTIEEIAKGANHQARDTEEGVKIANELSEIISEDLIDMEILKSQMEGLRKSKDEGIIIVNNLANKNHENNEAMAMIHEMVLKTNESAEKISSATSIINGIAEQTNLLALNAAIEAARAGEAGKGFSVVAEEIRKLAEESSKSVNEIDIVVSGLQRDSENAVTTMIKAKEIIKEQTEDVEITNIKYQDINKAVEEAMQIVEKSTDSVNNMKNKKDEFIQIIENLSAISQQNAAGTEEASASVEEQTAAIEEIANSSEALASLAEEMQESIKRFKY
ncbi:methyl-accepting chemotaxis protein [Alkaliphilus transvaalensis]|uniref:methyl-accepting chemotaxis protein n=1 Tax=Alkaliphilus transvaalensis TaxID=114628 RepID=UPI000688FFE7|nr:methyl-accepting chemotaxis protein [Alkaliphilus transvaalensis]